MRKFSSLCRVPLRWIFLSLSLDWKFHMQVHSNRPQHNFCWNFLCIFSTTKIQFKCSRNVFHRIPKIHEIFTGNSERKYRSTDLNKHLLSMFTPAAVKDDNRRMQLNFYVLFICFIFVTHVTFYCQRARAAKILSLIVLHTFGRATAARTFFNFRAQLQLCSSLDFLNPFIFRWLDWAASIHAFMKIQFLMSWLIYVEVTISICFPFPIVSLTLSREILLNCAK